jgi:hypothetical protein
MSWAEDTSSSAPGLGADLDWPSGDGDEARTADGAADSRTQGDDESLARGYFLGQPPDAATEEVHVASAAGPTPAELERALRDGALRFESLVGNCQAELQDTVAAHISDLEQTIATGTDELNRAAAQRITDLEEAVDVRLAELQRAALNDRIARLGARVTSVGRLAVLAVVVSILAFGVAVAALAVAAS